MTKCGQHLKVACHMDSDNAWEMSFLKAIASWGYSFVASGRNSGRGIILLHWCCSRGLPVTCGSDRCVFCGNGIHWTCLDCGWATGTGFRGWEMHFCWCSRRRVDILCLSRLDEVGVSSIFCTVEFNPIGVWVCSLLLDGSWIPFLGCWVLNPNMLSGLIWYHVVRGRRNRMKFAFFPGNHFSLAAYVRIDDLWR